MKSNSKWMSLWRTSLHIRIANMWQRVIPWGFLNQPDAGPWTSQSAPRRTRRTAGPTEMTSSTWDKQTPTCTERVSCFPTSTYACFDSFFTFFAAVYCGLCSFTNYCVMVVLFWCGKWSSRNMVLRFQRTNRTHLHMSMNEHSISVKMVILINIICNVTIGMVCYLCRWPEGVLKKLFCDVRTHIMVKGWLWELWCHMMVKGWLWELRCSYTYDG